MIQTGSVCELINGLSQVFFVLRSLCFAGAAFVLMSWAWGYIAPGKDAKGPGIEEMKSKGLGMVVGFILLFSVGLITMFMPDITGCGVLNW